MKTIARRPAFRLPAARTLTLAVLLATVAASLVLSATALRAQDLYVEGANSPYLFDADATYGNVYVANGADGILNQVSNVLTITNQLQIGNNGYAGVYNLSGTGIANVAGTTFLGGSNTTASDTLNLSGSAQFAGASVAVGYDGIGVVNQSGNSTLSPGTGVLYLSYGAGGQGTYNLNGGTLTTGQVSGDALGGTNSTFNLNGGTLRATANAASFFQGVNNANVRNGGRSSIRGGSTPRPVRCSSIPPFPATRPPTAG